MQSHEDLRTVGLLEPQQYACQLLAYLVLTTENKNVSYVPLRYKTYIPEWQVGRLRAAYLICIQERLLVGFLFVF